MAAGNSSNSFGNKRTWQDAPSEDSKHASPDTERQCPTAGCAEASGFFGGCRQGGLRLRGVCCSRCQECPALSPTCNLECCAPPLPSREPRAPLLRPGALRDLRLLRQLPAEVGLVKGFCFETVFCAAARSRSAASLPSPRPPTLFSAKVLVSCSYLRPPPGGSEAGSRV